MKILLLSNMYPSKTHLFYGVFVKNFAESMTQQGATIDKVVITGRGTNLVDKIKKYISYYLTSLKKIASQNYDVIYVHSASHALIPVALIRPLIKKPIIINIHGSDVIENSLINKLLLAINKKIIERCNLIVIPSHAFEEKVSEKMNLPSTFVSPSGGINRKIFAPSPNQKKESAYSNIGYISRIDEQKGWDTFIEAIDILRRKKPELNIKAIIVGTGSQVNAMNELIVKFNLSEIIQHIPQLAQVDLPAIHHTLDVFVFPTRRESESLGLVGLEAMSCGIPIIASRIGGIKDYIVDGENGFSFQPGNSCELADKIAIFLGLTNERKTDLAKGAIVTAEKYDSGASAEKLYEKIKVVCRKHSLCTK